MTLEVFTQLITTLLAICGGLVLIVSVITEVIKNLRPLQPLPTNIIVMALSIVGALIVFPLYFDTQAIEMAWYMWIATVVLGFIISFVAMYGWAKFKELWDRSKYPKDTEQE